MSFSTAWSANAVSICQSTGLGKVERIEVSRRYRLSASSPLRTEEVAKFAAMASWPKCLEGTPLMLPLVVEPLGGLPGVGLCIGCWGRSLRSSSSSRRRRRELTVAWEGPGWRKDGSAGDSACRPVALLCLSQLL